MSYLEDALNETHPGHNIDVDKVNAWFEANNIIVVENWQKRQREAAAAYKAAEKAAADARLAAAPVYTGTAVPYCQASVYPGRGAQTRCGNRGKLFIVVRDKWHPEDVLAVCRTHAKLEYFEPKGAER